jgi:hypothetical protein
VASTKIGEAIGGHAVYWSLTEATTVKIQYLAYDLAMDDMPHAKLFLLDIPVAQRGIGLLGGRFGWAVAESGAETASLQLSLAAGNWASVTGWYRKPSNAPHRTAIMLLPPTAEEWPHLVLCRWHPEIAAMAMKDDPDAASRERYSLEAFMTAEEAGQFAATTTEQLVRSGFLTDDGFLK